MLSPEECRDVPKRSSQDISRPHKSARLCLSTGADSAIFLHDDGGQSIYNGSEESSRSPSRSTCFDNNLNALSVHANEPADASLGDLNFEIPTQDEASFRKPGQDNTKPMEPSVETINPCLFRPASCISSHPALSAVKTYPVFQRPNPDYPLHPVHGARSSCPSQVGQSMPIVDHYGPLWNHRNGPCSPYYAIQSGNDGGSCISSQYCINPNQPVDVRVRDPAAVQYTRPRLCKTASVSNSTSSAYYGNGSGASKVSLHRLDSYDTQDPRKKPMFLRLVTTTLSSVYAIFVIVLGAILYINDVLGTVFQVYLFMVAITFYIFIHVDIRRYLKAEHLEERHRELVQAGLIPATIPHHPSFIRNSDFATKPDETRNPKSHIKRKPYGFKTGRHAGSLYLKLGAVAFCFGSMIHDGLVFSKRLDVVVTQLYSSCMNIIDLFTPALNLVFSFYQLYFIFKHSNIIISRYQELARFGVMHSIAVNLCVWFRTLVDETIDEFSRKWTVEGYDANKDMNANNVPEVLKHIVEDAAWHGPAPVSAAASYRVMELNHSNAALTACMPETVLANIAQEAAPYLYPFTIEYTLIAAAVWYLIWSNIGGDTEEESHENQSDIEKGRGYFNRALLLSEQENNKPAQESKSALYMIHVDCRSTSKGLFSGIFVLVGTVISIIIFFVTISVEEYTATGLILNNVSELSLYLLTGVTTIFAFWKTHQLDLNHYAMKHSLDDFLLFVALPCFFIFSLFSILAGISAYNPLSITVNTASMLQVILQTAFIFDGLRRCSNSQELQRKKPGRELITFLIVCNVALWTFSTFEIKRSETNPSQMLFYGEFEWSIISHLSVPLTIFYRFHSSVCLVDIWRSAYQPAESH